MFNKDIKRTIGKVLVTNGYKLGPALGEGVLYYIKRYSDYLGFYIGCRDNRSSGGGAITVDLHFTGIMSPDDCLMRFYSGIHVSIIELYDYNVTDQLVIAAGKKIQQIEKYISTASEMVLNELKNPIFCSDEYPFRALHMYSEILLVYDTLREDENLKESFTLLKANSHKVYTGEILNIRILDFCSEFIDELPKDYFINKGIYQYLDYNKNMDHLKEELARYIYAQEEFGR